MTELNEQEPDKPNPVSMANNHVLVVDDNQLTAKLVSEFLLTASVRSSQALHGISAVNLLEKVRPALVLVDLDPPVKAGIQSIQLIRAAKSGSSIPILGIASFDPTLEANPYISRTVSGLITKPVRLGQFMEIISAFIDIGQPTN